MTCRDVIAEAGTLILRRLRADDLDAFLAYRDDPEVARYQSWAPMTRDQAREFLHDVGQGGPVFRPGSWMQIAIADRETDQLMGDMGLYLAPDEQEVELGITLARPFHGQGHGRTALACAIELAWELTGADLIRCGTDNRNAPSLAMIRACGFGWTHREDMGDGVTDELFAMARPR